MNAGDILEVLNRAYLTNPKFLINNLYVFGWESDYLAMTKSGYWYEVEVKVSRSDFLADFKKKEKHLLLSGQVSGTIPNYFAYCVPRGLITADEVPEYAGLYYVNSANDHYYTCEKATPLLHKQKTTAEELGLLEKFYYNYKSMFEKDKQRKQRETELRTWISFLKAEFKAATGMDVKELI